MMFKKILMVLSLLFLHVFIMDSIGQTNYWQENGLRICQKDTFEGTPKICPAPQNGAIVIWRDLLEGGLPNDVCGQRITGIGQTLWATNGATLLHFILDSYMLLRTFTSEGNTSYYYGYEETPDLYVQKMDVNGSTQWGVYGTNTSLPVNAGYYPTTRTDMICDGSGGVIMVSHPVQIMPTSGGYLYCQRVDSSGSNVWGAGGIQLHGTDVDEFGLCSDGAGGAIFAWVDRRDAGDYKVYAQRLNASGTKLWGSDVPVCNESGYQIFPLVIATADGGAIIAWRDTRATPHTLYAQRLNSNGAPQWTANGIPVAGGDFSPPKVFLSDGQSGVLVVFKEGSSLYVTRIYANATMWASKLLIASDLNLTEYVAVESSGGDIIVAWFSGSNDIIYCRRISSTGTKLWDSDKTICAIEQEKDDIVICSDGNGGAIISWEQDFDIYAQRVTADGTLGHNASLPVNNWKLYY